jgi:hypothetical protein
MQLPATGAATIVGDPGEALAQIVQLSFPGKLDL